MKKAFFIILLLTCIQQASSAQKIAGIYVNLYTDSLKKGFYNYINIDGKLSDGTWTPLDSTQLKFTANTGHFKGNDLFIDSSYAGDSVVVKAALRSDPKVYKEVIIYIRKRGFDEPLKSSEDILVEMRNEAKKKKKQ